jgi:hypothetical protein
MKTDPKVAAYWARRWREPREVRIVTSTKGAPR